MRFIQITLLLVFLAAVGTFALQNNTITSVQFLNWKIEAPISLLTVAIYVLGMISGGAVFGFIRLSLRRVAERSEPSR